MTARVTVLDEARNKRIRGGFKIRDIGQNVALVRTQSKKVQRPHHPKSQAEKTIERRRPKYTWERFLTKDVKKLGWTSTRLHIAL